MFTLMIMLCSTAFSQPLRVVTEIRPPMQMVTKDNVVTGAMVDVVNAMLKHANIDSPIEVYPWARSYQMALTQNNTLIFSMFRNNNREKKFQWIGKLLTVHSYLVSLKSTKNLTVTSLDDAKKYSVGSIRDDLSQHYLCENGFVEHNNLYLNSDYQVLWQMLYSGRTDLVFTNDLLWRYEVKYAGLDPSKVQFVYQVPNFATDLYIAASLDVEQTMVVRLQNALNAIKASGEYHKILNKWQLNPKRNSQQFQQKK